MYQVKQWRDLGFYDNVFFQGRTTYLTGCLRGQHGHCSAGASHGAGVLVHGGILLFALASLRLLAAAATEQVPVIVATEMLAEEIQRQRVDARVDKGQAEPDDLEDVPEEVVQAGVEVIPHDVDVTRQPANDKDANERQYNLGDLLPRVHLSLLLIRNLAFLENTGKGKR